MKIDTGLFFLDANVHALQLLVSNMKKPPRGVAEMHALIAKQHPRLFARHADAIEAAPVQSEHPEPAVIFRGARCLCCGRATADPTHLKDGVEPDCRTKLI